MTDHAAGLAADILHRTLEDVMLRVYRLLADMAPLSLNSTCKATSLRVTSSTTLCAFESFVLSMPFEKRIVIKLILLHSLASIRVFDTKVILYNVDLNERLVIPF